MNIEEVIDKQAIMELQVRYSMALDTGSYEELDHIFTVDVIADYEHAGQHEGIETIKEACRVALDPLTSSQHQNGNHWSVVEGEYATAGCYFTVHQYLENEPGGEHFSMGGRYEDELIRTEDGWRITKRKLALLWSEGNPGVRFNR